MTIGKHVHYSGHVQGVGFRYTARGLAGNFRVAGWVRKPLEEGLLFQALDRACQGRLRLPHVLLVEDELDLSRVLIATFERHGIKIFPAATGRDAIELAGRLPLDLMVLDVNLPEVDGFSDDATVVVVDALFTVCGSARKLLPVKLLSPE